MGASKGDKLTFNDSLKKDTLNYYMHQKDSYWCLDKELSFDSMKLWLMQSILV